MNTTIITDYLPQKWTHILKHVIDSNRFQDLIKWLDLEMAHEVVFPPTANIFTAYSTNPIENIKVVIIGQDPYHGINQAHGLSFSVLKGDKQPPSLRNIFKELESDLGFPAPPKNVGNLTYWSNQGVFLLNSVLTVTESKPNSHKNKGWEEFTDATIQAISKHHKNVVFILWGGFAQKKSKFIDQTKHLIIATPHPSPLGAYRGFWDSKPFSKTNTYLVDTNQTPIDWQIKL